MATRCREAGWSVAAVDRQPFGGTCALRGCVPKKVLVAAADAAQGARDLTGKGVSAGLLALDWPELMRFKRSLIGETTERTEQNWARMGVEQFHGKARFVGPTTLAIGDDRLTGRHILIAASAVPSALPFPDAGRLVTSDRFLDLERMPSRVRWIPRTDKRAVDGLDEVRAIPKLRLAAAQGGMVGGQLVTNLPPEKQIGHLEVSEVPDPIGGPWRTRTSDPLIKSRADEPPTDTHDEVSLQDSEASA